MPENAINNDGDAAPLALIAALPTQAERNVLTVLWAEDFKPAKASTNVFMKWCLGIKAHTCFCLQWIKQVREERIKWEGALLKMEKARQTLYAPPLASLDVKEQANFAAVVAAVDRNTKAMIYIARNPAATVTAPINLESSQPKNDIDPEHYKELLALSEKRNWSFMIAVLVAVFGWALYIMTRFRL